MRISAGSNGVEPEKPYSGRFVVRVAPSLHQRAAVEAKRRGLSFNRFIEQSVEDALSMARA